MTPGKMLCFYGPGLKQNKAILDRLSDRKLLVKERYKGGYSLTQAGYAAMINCK